MSERLVLAHGCSLSNLPLFVAAASGLFADEGLAVEAPAYTAMSLGAQALASGRADLGTAAFTTPLIDAYAPYRPVIVAGSGLMGIAVLARAGITEVAALAGRQVGTFRGDLLEVLLHDLLASSGLGMGDVEIRYLDDIEEAIGAFLDGRLCAITLAEPHASQLRAKGAVELSDGTELWGAPFPDTVLVASGQLLAQRPEVVSAAIRALLRAEDLIQEDFAGSIRHATMHFGGYGLRQLAEAARRQPPCIDIRPLVPVILGRWPSLQHLSLVPADRPPPEHAFSFDLLGAELERRQEQRVGEGAQT